MAAFCDFTTGLALVRTKILKEIDFVKNRFAGRMFATSDLQAGCAGAALPEGLTVSYVGLETSVQPPLPALPMIAFQTAVTISWYHAQRRSSRPPNPPIGGAQANFGGPS